MSKIFFNAGALKAISIGCLMLADVFFASAQRGRDFTSADSIAALYPRHALDDLQKLSAKLTAPLSTQEEKFRAIYKWVTGNIAFDYAASLEVKKAGHKKDTAGQKHRNRILSARAAKALAEDYKTVCTGYAWLVRQLSLYAGIPCEIVDGYGRSAQTRLAVTDKPNHSWNAVRLNGHWFLCDPTWSSGVYDSNLEVFLPIYNDAYFLTEPSVFVRNHYPLDTKWMLLDSISTLDQFLKGPLFYNYGVACNIDRLYPETFEIDTKRTEPVVVQFGRKGNEPVGKIQFYVNKASRKEFTTPAVSRDSTGLYSLQQTFSSKGTYNVHLMLDDRYALTYRVNVR